MTSNTDIDIAVAGQLAARPALPDEIVELVAIELATLPRQLRRHNHHTRATDLRSFSLVSRQWHVAATPLLWETVHSQYGPIDNATRSKSMQHQTARNVPRLGRHVRRLYLGYQDVPAAEAAQVCTEVIRDLEAFPHLTTLGLGRYQDGYPSILDDTVAFAIFTAEADLLRNLRSLSWTYSGKGLVALLLRLPALRSLKLPSDTSPAWELHSTPLPLPFRLTNFEVSSDLFLPTSHLIPLLYTSLPTLTDLALSFNLLRDVVDLGKDSTPSLPQLSTLRLVCSSFGNFTADILWALGQLPSLRHLSLIPFPYDECQPPAEFLLGLSTGLETLDLAWAQLESQSLIDYIKQNSSGTSPTITIPFSTWSEEEARAVVEAVEKEGGNLELKDGRHTFRDTPAIPGMPRKALSTRTARTTRSRAAAAEVQRTKVDRLSTLPTELLTAIVDLVPDENDELARVSLVSKAFYDVATPKLYKRANRLYARHRGFTLKNSLRTKRCAMWKTMHKKPSLGVHLRHVLLDYDAVPREDEERLCLAVQADLKLCTSVRQLHLWGYPSFLDDAVAQAIADAGLATTTTELSWSYSGSGVEALLRALPNLKNLGLQGGHHPIVDWKAPRPLSSLALQNLNIIDPSLALPVPHFLSIITSSLPTLRTMSLPSRLLLALKNESLPSLLRMRLTLDAEGVANNGAALIKALQQCPALEDLFIHSPRDDDAKTLDGLFPFPPPLAVLLGLPNSIEFLDLRKSGMRFRDLSSFLSKRKVIPRTVMVDTFADTSRERRLREEVEKAGGRLWNGGQTRIVDDEELGEKKFEVDYGTPFCY
ncbi:hypothetical protein BCR35DRAFT_324033 [Leucosporidium creatinivorum]|uniref:F-box domain-containing protein n=1 Tax=Leucosporidium creatinivorum TaxID=106004 RepID=A0A1Y2G2D9_9BASI|nr:hypothetical protein BCR35DRAFT_324033 [Leucosporidium creatinivorum]